MRAVLDDLLELARTGAAALDLRSHQFADGIDDDWMEGDTAAVTVDIETERELRAERSQLEQLFTNLIRNAADTVELASP